MVLARLWGIKMLTSYCWPYIFVFWWSVHKAIQCARYCGARLFVKTEISHTIHAKRILRETQKLHIHRYMYMCIKFTKTAEIWAVFHRHSPTKKIIIILNNFERCEAPYLFGEHQRMFISFIAHSGRNQQQPQIQFFFFFLQFLFYNFCLIIQ